MDVNNTLQKVIRLKMLHTVHNCLFVQHHFHRTNPLIHMNSRLQYANTKLTTTKCVHGHTFNLLYKDWMADKLDNRETSQEETQIFNHLLALQPHCYVDQYPRALAACLARDPDFLAFFLDSDNRAPDFEIEYRT